MKAKTVKLHTFRLKDGIILNTIETIDAVNLPAEAKPIKGAKGEYGLIDFEPEYPDWYDRKTCDGFDASGLYLFFADTRIRDAFRNIAESEAADMKKWLKWIAIGGAVVIFVFILMRFI